MDKEPKICAYALGHLNQQFRFNRIAPCFRCVSKIGDHRTGLMSHAINSDEARQHRLTLMSGEWPDGCASCRDFEDAGTRSTRLHGLEEEVFDVSKLLRGYDPVTGSIEATNLTSIELRFGNECNLQCRHCDHVHSSKWEAERSRNPELMEMLGLTYRTFDQPKPDGYYDDIIENIVPHVREIMFSGGETLYQKQHYDFIERIPDEHAKGIRLLYVTNGTVVGSGKRNVLDMWQRFKEVNVIVSTDGTRELFEYFRHGASWRTVAENMRSFKRAGVYLTAEVTTSIFQILDLPRICDDLHELGVDRMSSSLVQSPAELNVRLIPQQIKDLVLAEWHGYKMSIRDPRKRSMVSNVGDMAVDYMMAENNTGRSWDDFRRYAGILDDILGTSVMRDCPTMARYL